MPKPQTCRHCHKPVEASNSELQLRTMLGESVSIFSTEDNCHLFPVQDEGGMVTCHGSPEFAQYLSDEPAAHLDPTEVDRHKAAYANMTDTAVH